MSDRRMGTIRLPFAEPSTTKIHRLPSADVSAGERFAALARQAAAQAGDVSLPVPARLHFLKLADDCETRAALADADAILAANAMELA